jgi:hypothetical protein
MTSNNQPLATAKGTSTLVRAKFGPGMLLQHEDLEQLNAYTRELNRLMFRSLFGCGVVCGLVVDMEVKCGKVNLTVGSGLALDCQGDPIYVPKPVSIVLDEECDPNIRGPLWVVLCGTEKCCAPRTSVCSDDEDESPSVCTRERDGYEIRVVRNRPQCVCSCRPEHDEEIPRRDPADKRDQPGRMQDQPGRMQDQAGRIWDRAENKCKCVDPNDACYKDHYDGKCGCDCEDCANCDCECVLLARLYECGNDRNHPDWRTDHRVRRFVRPVLMRDPQVEIEEMPRDEECAEQEQKRGADPAAEQTPEQAQTEQEHRKDRDSQPRRRTPRAPKRS